MKKFILSAALLMLAGCREAQAPHQVTDIYASDFQIETLADGLTKPWGIAVLPDGGYLVTDITGEISLIRAGSVSRINGGPENIYVDGQGGLLGVAISPDYKENSLVYLSYSYGDSNENGTAVYEAEFTGSKLEDGKTIFKASPGKNTNAHFGGRLAFKPDGKLLLSLGDGFAFREAAQDPKSDLGKIVELALKSNNDNKNKWIATSKVFSSGHRNVQGLVYDSHNDQVWAHEHGPRGGDELNLINKGANYGWPIVTTGVDYNGAKITPFKQKNGFTGYIYEWTPSIAPSGLAIYRGEMFPQWDGDAFMGALAGQSVWRVDLEDGKAVGTQRLLHDLNYRFRDVVVDHDGSLLLAVEAPEGGKVLRMSNNP